jgi:biotin carboxylase
LGIDVAVTAIEQARSRGLSVHLIGHAEDLARTEEACRLADTAEPVDFEDTDAAVEWARDRARRGQRFDVVFTCRELALPATARIADALGLAGNRPEVIDRVRSKADCRRHLAAAGFPQPSARHCHDAADARQAIGGGAGPWVLKPRIGSGSEGVSLVAGPDDLPRALSVLPQESRDDFLVEDFVDGPEYSVEGLFRNGTPHVLAVTAKEKLPPPFFVERGHTLPAPLDEPVRRDVEETVTRALRTLGLTHGLFHVELWLTAGGIVLGEVHARLGGDYIHRLLAHAVDGLEMFGEVYDDALGKAAPARPRVLRGAGATRYFTPPKGRFVAAKGWHEAAAHPAVLAAELALSPGDRIGFAHDSDGRAGALAVGGPTPQEAERLVAELVESVEFVIDPDETP